MSNRIQQSGYQSRGVLSPTAIGGVILVHVGLGAVILSMSAVTFIKLPDPVIWAWNIPKQTPPPPDKLAQAMAKVPSAHPISTVTKSTIPVVADKSVITDAEPTGPMGGFGGGTIVEPVLTPDPPPPVMVQAKADPRFVAGFQPPYPAAMLRQQMEGSVTVRVTIGSDGRVIDVAMISTADPAFFEATRRQALSKWRFLPATRDGVAVSSERVMTVHFHITD